MPAEERATTSGTLSKKPRIGDWRSAHKHHTRSEGFRGSSAARRRLVTCQGVVARHQPTLVVLPCGEASRRAGCGKSARPVRWAGWGNGAMPNGPSHRASPRLYPGRQPGIAAPQIYFLDTIYKSLPTVPPQSAQMKAMEVPSGPHTGFASSPCNPVMRRLSLPSALMVQISKSPSFLDA